MRRSSIRNTRKMVFDDIYRKFRKTGARYKYIFDESVSIRPVRRLSTFQTGTLRGIVLKNTVIAPCSSRINDMSLKYCREDRLSVTEDARTGIPVYTFSDLSDAMSFLQKIA